MLKSGDIIWVRNTPERDWEPRTFRYFINGFIVCDYFRQMNIEYRWIYYSSVKPD